MTDDPTPRLCPICREPYVADTVDIPQMRLVDRSEGPGWIAEEYVSTDVTVTAPESHRPCPNVREWTNAADGPAT